MKKAIVIGASSGIGLQLARVLSKDGYAVGLTGRRLELLNNLKKELPAQTFISQMDINNTSEAMDKLNGLIGEMGGVDLIVVSAGIGHINHELDWTKEQETITTNVLGVTAIINAAMQVFLTKKSGHLAVISSVAALWGSGECPAYNASKAFVSNYLEGIRCKVKKLKMDITVTDIKPGLVDTAMAKGEGLFWVMPLEKAADQIYTALRHKKDEVIVTKRWRIIAFLLKIMPKFLYYKL